MKNRTYVLKCSLVAALGGLLFGFDTAVISGAVEALQSVYRLSNAWLGFTVASALIGTMVGSLAAGWPSDRYGRRILLLGTGVLFFVSSVGCGLAWDWGSFLFFRFLGGLGVGAVTVVAPMYIAEISPRQKRGRLVALTQFNIVLGILLAFVSNYVIAGLHLGATEWRWMFGVVALPSAVYFILLLTNPESPRWLMSKGRREEARKVLVAVEDDSSSVEAELDAIQESIALDRHQVDEPFYCRKYLKPILLACVMGAFNQLSGINAVLYYAPTLFKMAGAAGESAMLQSVIIGLVNMVFTMVALVTIDRFGRKTLMLIGSIGYILSLAVIAWAFHAYRDGFAAATAAINALATGTAAGIDAPALAQLQLAETQALKAVGSGGLIILASLIVFIASHAIGQGGVILAYISEIFPNRVRARGLALGAFTMWVFAALVSQTFPVLFGSFGGAAVFAFFAVCMVTQLIWVVTAMTETKGIALEDMAKKLNIH